MVDLPAAAAGTKGLSVTPTDLAACGRPFTGVYDPGRRDRGGGDKDTTWIMDDTVLIGM